MITINLGIFLIYLISLIADHILFMKYVTELYEYTFSERGKYTVSGEYPRRYFNDYYPTIMVFSIFPIINTIVAIYYLIKIKLIKKYDYDYTIFDYLFDKFIEKRLKNGK